MNTPMQGQVSAGDPIQLTMEPRLVELVHSRYVGDRPGSCAAEPSAD